MNHEVQTGLHIHSHPYVCDDCKIDHFTVVSLVTWPQFQTIHSHFSFSLNECDDKDFCLRIFSQPENKITETKKGGKITPIVLLSTAMFICFNRPKNENARHNNS